MADPDYWSAMRKLWALQGEPLRPPAEAVDAMIRAAGPTQNPVLLLGVTPEFYGRFPEIVAIDRSQAMVNYVWPGDGPGKRAIVGSWQTELSGLGKFDVVVGDGSVNTLPSAEQVAAFFRAIDRVLAPGGRLVMRVYCQPEEKITGDEMVKQMASGHAGFHALRLRIGMYIAQREGAFVPVRKIAAVFDELFPDRNLFVAKCTGMTPHHFALIDAYKGSEEFWYVPTLAMLHNELGKVGGDARLVRSGSYPYAQDCPIVVLRHS